MKVVLSTSPHIKHSAVLEADFLPRNDLMYTFAPLGILMLCASLREVVGITPEIYDINSKINNNEIVSTNIFYESAASSIIKCGPDVLGFMTECDSYHHILQICHHVKKLRPNCFIILGGPHATAVARPTMKKWDCVDAIVLGEGELTFVELIQGILSKSTAVPKGAMMKNSTGEVVEGGNRALVEHLDDLPFPAYDLYSPAKGEELFIEVGRGCPFQCTFCSTSPFWLRKHRVKSPERIINEIRYLKTLHGTGRIHFTHDLFTANATWAEEVCHTLIKAKIGVKWTCSSRVDTINERLLQVMAEAGCSAIFFGIESGSERVLEIIQKKITLNQVYDAIKLCYKYGITPNAGLIVGFPFEDARSFEETFEAYLQIMKLGAKPIHIFSFCPFAQSSIYASLKNLECSQQFLDVPLPEPLNSNNRQLVSRDKELYGSYFRPELGVIPGIAPGVLFAVDEFAILVDAVRIPSIIAAQYAGGMHALFFSWVAYIDTANKKRGKASFRRYFGSPEDFCAFLVEFCETNKSKVPDFIFSLLSLINRNFEIASSLTYAEPLSMATYRSKVLDTNLTDVKADFIFYRGPIIDMMELNYDVLPMLKALIVPDDFEPVQRKINVIWQKKENGTVSLIQVNDFVYHVLKTTNGQGSSFSQLLRSWYEKPENISEINYMDLFKDLQQAVENDIVTIA